MTTVIHISGRPAYIHYQEFCSVCGRPMICMEQISWDKDFVHVSCGGHAVEPVHTPCGIGGPDPHYRDDISGYKPWWDNAVNALEGSFR